MSNDAICLQPLTQAQLDNYFKKIGEDLDGLQKILEKDENLQKLSKIPLMLNIMVSVYHKMPLESIQIQKVESIGERQKQLFELYVEKMFDKDEEKRNNQTTHDGETASPPPYPKEKMINWLSWLAKNMKNNQKSEFLVEELQPTYISSNLNKLFYASIVFITAFFIWTFIYINVPLNLTVDHPIIHLFLFYNALFDSKY